MNKKWYDEEWAGFIIIPAGVFIIFIFIFSCFIIVPWLLEVAKINSRNAENWGKQIIDCPISSECKK